MGLSYRPQPSDVLLTTGPKCGTAWVQQILHGLRSGGNMDFEEIDMVFPSVELYYGYNEDGDLGLAQPFEPPRYFRMHAPYELTPKGFRKHIVMTRNPKDSAVSAYFFFRNWLFDEEEVSLDEFVEWIVIKENVPHTPIANAQQLRHLISWYPHRKDEDVLWLHFEDLKQDLAGCIRLIAKFVGLGTNDPELLKVVEEQASIDFMKKHKSKFDSHQIKDFKNEKMGLSPDRGIKDHDGRVRNGTVDEGVKLLSTEMSEKVDIRWKSLVEPVTGYSSYEDMRAAINTELGRSFQDSA